MEEGPEDSELVGILPLGDYERLRRAYMRNAFLAMVELHGWEAALVLLSFAPPLPSGLPPPPPLSETTSEKWRVARAWLGMPSKASRSVVDRPQPAQLPLFGEELPRLRWIRECALK